MNAPETPLSTPSASTPETAVLTASPAPSASIPVSPTPFPDSENTLKVGETAHLANWDVTVQRAEYGYEGFSYGWKVNVCYVAASDLAVDGRIKVSDRVWTALLQDQESGGPVESVPIPEFERDHTWTPEYANTSLSVGDCNLGWIGIHNENPDLDWPGIVYTPSTGETITWES